MQRRPAPIVPGVDVGTARDEQGCEIGMTKERHRVQRPVAVLPSHFDVGASAQQHLHDASPIRVPGPRPIIAACLWILIDGELQRRLAVLVALIHVGTLAEQQTHDFCIAVPSGQCERRHPISLPADRDAFWRQQFNHPKISVLDCILERRRFLLVAGQRVGAVLKQHADDVLATFARRTVERCPSAALTGVHIGSRRKQPLDDWKTAVRRGQV